MRKISSMSKGGGKNLKFPTLSFLNITVNEYFLKYERSYNLYFIYVNDRISVYSISFNINNYI